MGAVPKAVIHYSILNFYINSFAPEGDMKKADGRTATMIGSWAEYNKISSSFAPLGLKTYSRYAPFISLITKVLQVS